MCGKKSPGQFPATLSSSPSRSVLVKSIVPKPAGRRGDSRCRFHLPLARGWQPAPSLDGLCCSVLWESKHSTPVGVEERCPRWMEGRIAPESLQSWVLFVFLFSTPKPQGGVASWLFQPVLHVFLFQVASKIMLGK